MHAVDVYESQEAADRLVKEQVAPIAAQLGLAAPDITQYDVRAYLAPR